MLAVREDRGGQEASRLDKPKRGGGSRVSWTGVGGDGGDGDGGDGGGGDGDGGDDKHEMSMDVECWMLNA